MYLLNKEAIQHRMKSKGSLLKVAKETGLSYPTVHKFATDKGAPTYDTLVVLSKYFMHDNESFDFHYE